MRGSGGAVLAGAAAALGFAGPAHAGHCQVGPIASFPVTMVGRSPTTMLKVDGKPARFTLDSGAWWSVISQGSTVDLGLRQEPAPPFLQVIGIGGTARTSMVTVKLGIAGATVPNVTFLVTPNEFGGAGVLGQNVLGIADVEYDLAGGVVRLMKASDCWKANLAYWAPDKPFSMLDIQERTRDTHTVGTVIVNGTRLDATFDTGASTTVLSLAAAKRAGIDVHGPGAKDGGETYGFGPHPVHTWIVPVADLKIGNEEIKAVHVRVADADMVNMLVGADFFMSHHVYVANSQQKMFFTYNGGPIFDTDVPRGAEAAAATPAAADPSGAEDFYRRAMMRETQGSLTGAIADLDHAITAAPDNETYVLARARLHLRAGQVDAGRTDLARALKLKPDDPDALLEDAIFLHHDGKDADARTELAAAAKAASPAAGTRVTIGEIYVSLGDYDQGVAEFDQWVKTHPGDIGIPNVENSRCWARALAGRELDKAVADCNAAIKARPKNANYLDSRALAEFRAGSLDKALADYEAALKLDPNLSWSLYCRGLVKRAKGDKASGQADMDAALKRDPDIAKRAKGYGLSA